MKKTLAFFLKVVFIWAKGKKTYLIGILIAILGILDGTGVFMVPEYIWPILAAAGLGTMRSGISEVSKQVKK